MANAVSKRAIYMAILTLANEDWTTSVSIEGAKEPVNVTADDFKAFAENEIALLDKRNEKRSTKPTKNQAENAEVLNAILDKYPAGTDLYASKVGIEMGISTNKASSILRLNPDKFKDNGEVRVETGKSKVHVYTVL